MKSIGMENGRPDIRYSVLYVAMMSHSKLNSQAMRNRIMTKFLMELEDEIPSKQIKAYITRLPSSKLDGETLYHPVFKTVILKFSI